jgi:Chromo (CHRromatin Organisation MOdifier) domain
MNHLGVRLLDQRLQSGKVEYFVEWKGRPESENSWEKEVTISRERITD